MPINAKDKGNNPGPGTRASARTGNNNISVPEDMQDIKTAHDGRKFLEKYSLLCPPGEPITNAALAYCLHQVSAMQGVPKQTVNAIRATAFLLEEIEEQAINETIRSAFESQITEFTSDMKMLADDVRTKIDEHQKEALTQLTQATAKATASILVAPRAAQASQANTYASALINPPPNDNPKLAAREGIRAHQFLITGIKGSAFGQYNMQQLKAELNKMAKSLGMRGGKIRSVIAQKDGNILIEVDSDASARWFANKANLAEFCVTIGTDVAFKSRMFNVLTFNVPLNLDPRDENHRAEINEANGLEINTISKIRWAKPPNRRSPSQRSAHLILSFTNPESANTAISSGLIVCNKKCHVERIKKEPIRCLRCQGWNHIARDCSELISKCGNCAENHSTEDCRQPGKARCVSCKTDNHASWNRECPTFLRKVDEYNERNPDNLLPFFPATAHWTWSAGETNLAQGQKNQNTYKKASTLGKQQATENREKSNPPVDKNPFGPSYPSWTDRLNLDTNATVDNHWWDDDPPAANNNSGAGPSNRTNSTPPVPARSSPTPSPND